MFWRSILYGDMMKPIMLFVTGIMILSVAVYVHIDTGLEEAEYIASVAAAPDNMSFPESFDLQRISDPQGLIHGDGKKHTNIDHSLVDIFESTMAGAVPLGMESGTPTEDRIRVILVMAHVGAPIPEGLGIEVEIVYEELIQATIPIRNLEVIAANEYVKLIKMPSRPIPTSHTVGTTISEGTDVIGSIIANHAGYTGDGIKVAVIDAGFDINNDEIKDNIVEYRSFSKSYGIRGDDSDSTDHGTAVAEIVVDIAPDVELYLYHVSTSGEFLDLVRHIIARGDIDIITMSLAWFTDVGAANGKNHLAVAVDQARDAGILFVVSAGNEAESHWQGRFSDTDGDGWHNFRERVNALSVTVKPDELLNVSLSWWDSPLQNYALCLFRYSFFTGTYTQIDCYDNHQPTMEPFEKLSFEPDRTEDLYIRIKGDSATRAVDFQLFSSYDLKRYAIPASSITIPADAKGALAVGAVHWRDGTLETFSSQGPTVDGRIKPDIVSPDGVSTTSYEPDYFFGTSASAPHVAGAAALVMEKYPDATVKQIRELLEENTKNYHSKRNTDGTGIVDVSWLPTALVVKVPDAPTGLTATAGDTKVSLDWNAPENNGGAAITDYIVQYKLTSNNAWTDLSGADNTATSATISNLTNGSEYQFRVAAVNSVGTGDYSSTVSATPTTPPVKPDAPTGLTATAGDTKVSLDWNAPENNGGAAITDYMILFKQTSRNHWMSFNDELSPLTNATVDKLTNGISYDFIVVAVNSAGHGKLSDKATAMPVGAAPVKPDAPTGLTATAGDTEVSLDWNAPENNGGAAITDYIVQYKLTSNNAWTDLSGADSTATSATISNLTNGSEYQFRVAAKNSAGTGPWSTIITSTPLAFVTLHISAFYDSNSDGIKDANESAASDIFIITYTPSTDTIKFLRTGADGTDTKSDLPAKTFYAIVLPPDGKVVTTHKYDLRGITSWGVLKVDNPTADSTYLMNVGINDDPCLLIPPDSFAAILLKCE